MNRWEPENGIKALETGVLDAVQVIYNIFDQAPEDKLFPLCDKLDIGVIARVPFDEGTERPVRQGDNVSRRLLSSLPTWDIEPVARSLLPPNKRALTAISRQKYRRVCSCTLCLDHDIQWPAAGFVDTPMRPCQVVRRIGKAARESKKQWNW